MVELIIDGNKTTRTKKEIYSDFVDSKLFNAIKGGILSNPRAEIKQWLEDSYSFTDTNEYDYITDHIAVRV